MSEAPERIWAITEPDDISADILGEVYAQQIPDGMNGTPVEYVRADRIEELEADLRHAKISEAFWRDGWHSLDQDKRELEAKLAKALTALGDVQLFVKDLEPYAEQGHTPVPALQKACTVYVELTGGKDE